MITHRAGNGGKVDAVPRPPVTETPDGPATIEAYTVVYDRNGPAFGLIIGRQDSDGARFCAHTPNDPALFEAMVTEEFLGRKGTVSHSDGRNTFTPNN